MKLLSNNITLNKMFIYFHKYFACKILREEIQLFAINLFLAKGEYKIVPLLNILLFIILIGCVSFLSLANSVSRHFHCLLFEMNA